ncbi:phage-related protein [Nocardioides thalensis]|uniref:Phage-related protein n=1 Tax=Nocardioides thalensis TaxID=1914755 RepID=A0A853BX87_9ACTN|nr:hypothetical protein [Nocardioides thalensis]NYI99580.1 phage-related protein [Nocardioides thalensis]
MNELIDARSSIHAAKQLVEQISPGQASELADLQRATTDAVNRLLRVQATLTGAGL